MPVFRTIKTVVMIIALFYLARNGYQWQQAKEQAAEASPNLPSVVPSHLEEKSDIEAASLVFPVEQHDLSAVISAFGDARGDRLHQGIDIKAERGTAVLAVTTGFIERIKEGGKGGKQIYLRAADGRLFYYAHLDQWAVDEMEAVEAGQKIGAVGNSGNAFGASPHLHFEILLGQEREAVDPTPYFLPHS